MKVKHSHTPRLRYTAAGTHLSAVTRVAIIAIASGFTLSACGIEPADTVTSMRLKSKKL
jgi:hypothetical protein